MKPPVKLPPIVAEALARAEATTPEEKSGHGRYVVLSGDERTESITRGDLLDVHEVAPGWMRDDVAIGVMTDLGKQIANLTARVTVLTGALEECRDKANKHGNEVILDICNDALGDNEDDDG